MEFIAKAISAHIDGLLTKSKINPLKRNMSAVALCREVRACFSDQDFRYDGEGIFLIFECYPKYNFWEVTHRSSQYSVMFLQYIQTIYHGPRMSLIKTCGEVIPYERRNINAQKAL